MKIYIGNGQINDESYKVIAEPAILNYLADDSECNIIVLHKVLTKNNLNEIISILDLCYKKLRIGGTLKIIDIDFDLLCYAYRKYSNLIELNNAVFEGSMRSFITRELIIGLIQNYHSDLGKPSLSRVQNIEFDLEFVRK